ncbi:MAG: dTDP-4-dehydrorhamnose 3,5-epimerase [Patescibacteria group bacterium]
MQVSQPFFGLYILEPTVYQDDRGYFYESYNFDKLSAQGLAVAFIQDNHTFSKKGVLRGLHFQLPPKGMGKLVRCTSGKIWDVAVDLRVDSITYKHWFGIELSGENKRQLYLPPGFAHGFYTIEDAEVLYKCTATFSKELEGAVIWNDPELKINWPVTDHSVPLLSQKDQEAPLLAQLNLPAKWE